MCSYSGFINFFIVYDGNLAYHGGVYLKHVVNKRETFEIQRESFMTWFFTLYTVKSVRELTFRDCV